jgi:hypothetical protein
LFQKGVGTAGNLWKEIASSELVVIGINSSHRETPNIAKRGEGKAGNEKFQRLILPQLIAQSSKVLLRA